MRVSTHDSTVSKIYLKYKQYRLIQMGVRYVFNDPVVIAICHTDDQVTIPCKNQILRLSSVTKFHILMFYFSILMEKE